MDQVVGGVGVGQDGLAGVAEGDGVLQWVIKVWQHHQLQLFDYQKQLVVTHWRES